MSVDLSPGVALRERFGDAVTTAEDEGWDAARLAFNLLVDQQPVAVATPSTTAETAEIVARRASWGCASRPRGLPTTPAHWARWMTRCCCASGG